LYAFSGDVPAFPRYTWDEARLRRTHKKPKKADTSIRIFQVVKGVAKPRQRLLRK
jgi:hypothetical protein